ncbi:hypothetical protein E0L36_00950 [Streptomyces sp. AJS327]|uniref:beta-ketoacyl synthase N-terminal-like domain-containing protein n=1 Tax=Streptomyces sp. AJS327 TaxID=2545265 RepID=UPI0015E05BBB|nr:beta-ketoacyl synthase N-terminal-like domain-containing protein [Streptomyces sp. AJS327]MBA0049527.1 hypothetical protein [Streptomyces sp. AJS327]QTC09982.1 beta-ketoacyl-CLF synthase II [Streptomyces sp.]
MSGVVVSGVGAVTAVGVGADALWSLVVSAGGGSAPLSERVPQPPPGLAELEPVLLAGLPAYAPEETLGKRGLRTLSRESTAFTVASVAARRDAGLPDGQAGQAGQGGRESDPSTGVAAGTTSAGLEDYVGLFAGRLERGVARVNPAQGPQTGLNAPASVVSIRTGAAGPNLTLATGRAAALDALAESARVVRSGVADVMIAGGAQLLTDPEVRARRSQDPAFGTVRAARPFDRDRSGALPGEAAVSLVLEDAAAARRRGAPALAELLGAGSAFGGAEPGRRAMVAALSEAGAEPGEVDAVVLSAPGCPVLDAAEAASVAALGTGGPPVCAVQGALGDCAGATGAVQSAVAVFALRYGLLPGTAGLRVLDPALAPLTVVREPEHRAVRRVMVLALDPRGYAAAVLFGAAPAADPSPASGPPGPSHAN